MAQQLDFEKLPANKHITVAIGPANSVADVDNPTASELNAMQPSSVSISWSDYDFGIQASEQTNDPSLADSSNYQTRGAANYGGSMSFYYPKDYDDNSNNHSLVYDLTDKPGTYLMVAIRIDGDTPTSADFADGDFVHVYYVQTDSETNSLTGSDDYRRTVGLLQQSVFSHYTMVGASTGTLTPSSATVTGVAGDVGRITVELYGRDVTNSLRVQTSDGDVVSVSTGGVYRLVGSGTAVITFTHPSGNSETVDVTVT